MNLIEATNYFLEDEMETSQNPMTVEKIQEYSNHYFRPYEASDIEIGDDKVSFKLTYTDRWDREYPVPYINIDIPSKTYTVKLDDGFVLYNGSYEYDPYDIFEEPTTTPNKKGRPSKKKVRDNGIHSLRDVVKRLASYLDGNMDYPFFQMDFDDVKIGNSYDSLTMKEIKEISEKHGIELSFDLGELQNKWEMSLQNAYESWLTMSDLDQSEIKNHWHMSLYDISTMVYDNAHDNINIDEYSDEMKQLKQLKNQGVTQ